MPTPKGAKELKAEGTMKKLATLRSAFEAVKADIVPGQAGYDATDQSDGLGHWYTQLSNVEGCLRNLENQASGWKAREQAIREAKDAEE